MYPLQQQDVTVAAQRSLDLSCYIPDAERRSEVGEDVGRLSIPPARDNQENASYAKTKGERRLTTLCMRMDACHAYSTVVCSS